MYCKRMGLAAVAFKGMLPALYALQEYTLMEHGLSLHEVDWDANDRASWLDHWAEIRSLPVLLP